MAGRSPSRSPVMTRGGIVCSVSPLAASAGIQVLAEGGNAFDAAIAVAAVEGVTVPPMCGLGGDVFAILYHGPSGRVIGINGSGVAPTGATPQLFRSKGYREMPLDGPLSISVPGEVDAWVTIHNRFGSRPFESLLEPAIGYAEEGFPLPPRGAHSFIAEGKGLAQFPSTGAILMNKGRPYSEGDVLVNRDLARSLRCVAKGGAEEFYRGGQAREIVKALGNSGALFTEQDFANHTTEVYEPPLSTTYRDYTVYQTRPPSQGFLMLEMLNIIEGFNLASLGPQNAEAIHLMVEAKKLAFADRNRYAGDPRFVDWPLDVLLSKDYAADRRNLIDPQRASRGTPAGLLAEAGGETSYFCVADGQGNCVSFIHSLSSGFGSKLIAQGTGILFNNRAGRGFTLEEGHPNVIAPGKRTMHTLNCYMAFQNARPVLVGGTPGGDFQPQGNVQVLTSLIDFGLDPQLVVEMPRWWSFPGTDPSTLGQPMQLQVEEGFPEETLRDLESRGHRITRLASDLNRGRVQLIFLDHQRGVKTGASDPRGDGHAAAI